MCGIAGIIELIEDLRETHAADPQPMRRALWSMIQSLEHRGPDALNIYHDGGVGLAHSRLSIIDHGGGHQPMSTADGLLTITFNGEIFNYVELRAELIRQGRTFRSQSDTEVILQAYAHYGDDCVKHLNGQWAFAIWDQRRQRLFISRDRIGIRPLFYTRAAGKLHFASEIKALFTQREIARRIDLTALDQMFTLWSTIPPRTIFEGINELPPGHSLIVEQGKIRVERYWQLNYPTESSATESSNRSTDDWADELLSLLVDATRLRLRADVPVGAYLSGGLDSSLTTALIRKYTGAPLKTFSVTFDDADFDESRYQQDVVRAWGTEHQSIRCRHEDIGRVFPDVVRHAEKPLLRTAPAPLYLLSQLVHEQGYKVVITGEGADEMCGGYDIFKEAKLRRFWARDPNSKYRPLLLKRLYPYLSNVQAQSPDYLKAFFHVRADDLSSPFFSHLPRWELTAKAKAFFSADVRRELQDYSVMSEMQSTLPNDFGRWEPFCQAQYLESAHLLPGYILSSQGDRMAMAHAVEGRFPFLDYRVMEFSGRIPTSLKMRGLDEKFLLKQIARGLVPESILRRPKQPYRAPDAVSFFDTARGLPRFDYVQELLSPKRLQQTGLFDPHAVGKLVQKICKGHAIGTKDNMALVGILSTQLLVDQFIDHNTPDITPARENLPEPVFA
ncbi:MAG: asparagine synthase (glutamine-hydrolyzing) [Planctomycetaceae bacterium]